MSLGSLTLQPREPELPSPFSLVEPDVGFPVLLLVWFPLVMPSEEGGIAHQHTA